ICPIRSISVTPGAGVQPPPRMPPKWGYPVKLGCSRTPKVEESAMRKLLLGAALAVLMSSAAHAERIAVSMALFDDNFLTVLRNGIQELADDMDDVDVQIEDAQNDVGKQLDQINNFIA